MNNNEFIDYLNTLHTYYAQNKNSYAENNFESQFYDKVMVKTPLCNFIIKQLTNNKPHVIILTGHAGDGKTSLMYQVVKQLDSGITLENGIFKIKLPSGKTCYCIKDFSEMADDKKLNTLKKLLHSPENDEYAFMVANTGPLINTFGKLYDNKETAEKAKIELIDALDNNNGQLAIIGGYANISVINVAKVDNTIFATDFLKNIIKEDLWSKCNSCPKATSCHIFLNRKLIRDNNTRVFTFLKMHYIWLAEHGERLTVRSMAEQLSYMLTGGYSCSKIEENHSNIGIVANLFPNLFFGYFGIRYDSKSEVIYAIKKAYDMHYDSRKLRVDEKLLIANNLDGFSEEVKSLLVKSRNEWKFNSGWKELLHRFYIFLNIDSDFNQHQLDEDVFSYIYPRYLALRDGSKKTNSTDIELVRDALAMIYIGVSSNGHEIPLTLSRGTGIEQNVQMVTGAIPNRKIYIRQEIAVDNYFDQNKNDLYLEIDGHRIDSILNLPLLNYFYDLKNGIISTNIDPQLSHGLESLKAKLSNIFEDGEDDSSIELIVLKNSGNEILKLDITEDGGINVINRSNC